jgi:hypothetical protein
MREGYGVDTGIVIDNSAAREHAGINDQFDRAITQVQKKLKEGQAKGRWLVPPPPPTPKR